MSVLILSGDCRARLQEMPPDSVDCVVTSPPYYGLRDYGVAGQIGLQASPEAYVAELVAVFAKVRRLLKPTGTLWLNIGDSYATAGGAGWQGKNGQRANRRFTAAVAAAKGVPTGCKPKDLIGIPWLLAFALRADGWWLRAEIIWHKPAPMPESVRDRPTRAHEAIFLLSKSERYFYDQRAARDPLRPASIGRLAQDIDAQSGSVRANGGAKTNGAMKAVKFGGNKHAGDARERLASGNDWVADPAGGANWRDVWTIPSEGYDGAHFATFPAALAERCIKAGCPIGGTVLDPFAGAGTVGVVADRMQRSAVLIELNADYVEQAERRIRSSAPMLAEVSVA